MAVVVSLTSIKHQLPLLRNLAHEDIIYSQEIFLPQRFLASLTPTFRAPTLLPH